MRNETDCYQQVMFQHSVVDDSSKPATSSWFFLKLLDIHILFVLWESIFIDLLRFRRKSFLEEEQKLAFCSSSLFDKYISWIFPRMIHFLLDIRISMSFFQDISGFEFQRKVAIIPTKEARAGSQETNVCCMCLHPRQQERLSQSISREIHCRVPCHVL